MFTNHETPIETSRLIFDDMYMIKVPVTSTRTELDIRLFGTVRTGYEEIDKSALDDLVVVMWSIARMAEHFKKGVPIRVIKYSDTKTIYESVTRHLDAWKYQIEDGINVNNAPFNDLIMLDEFANSVYEHAKFQFTAQYVNSAISRYMEESKMINKQNFLSILGNRPNSTQTLNDYREKKEELPTREGYSEFLKGTVMSDSRFKG
jgi:hypothetical protein